MCVPGCVIDGNDEWCPPNDNQGGWCNGRAFLPKDIGTMLRTHRSRVSRSEDEHRTRGYNEIIIDAYMYAERLPGAVEAFFYLGNDKRCGAGCEATARESLALFRSTYHGHEGVPMLVLDLSNAEAPFGDDPRHPAAD